MIAVALSCLFQPQPTALFTHHERGQDTGEGGSMKWITRRPLRNPDAQGTGARGMGNEHSEGEGGLPHLHGGPTGCRYRPAPATAETPTIRVTVTLFTIIIPLVSFYSTSQTQRCHKHAVSPSWDPQIQKVAVASIVQMRRARQVVPPVSLEAHQGHLSTVPHLTLPTVICCAIMD